MNKVLTLVCGATCIGILIYRLIAVGSTDDSMPTEGQTWLWWLFAVSLLATLFGLRALSDPGSEQGKPGWIPYLVSTLVLGGFLMFLAVVGVYLFDSDMAVQQFGSYGPYLYAACILVSAPIVVWRLKGV